MLADVNWDPTPQNRVTKVGEYCFNPNPSTPSWLVFLYWKSSRKKSQKIAFKDLHSTRASSTRRIFVPSAKESTDAFLQCLSPVPGNLADTKERSP